MHSLWTLRLTLVLAGFLIFAAPSAPQVPTSTPRLTLLGVWDLVSVKDYRPDGSALDWMGGSPKGQIIYTADGRMAVQFMRDPRATFSGSSMWTGDSRDLLSTVSASEIRDAFTGYYAYFGTWQIDERAGAVTHHVQSSLRPDEIGRNYVRPYQFSGDQLQFKYPVSAANGEARTRVIVFTRAERFK